MTKSFVGMGAEVCPICLTQHNEAVLLHERFSPTFPESRSVCTGWSLCPACSSKSVDFLGLVEVEERPAPNSAPSEWKCTGAFAHVRRTVAARIFNVPIPDSVPFAHVERGVLDTLKRLSEDAS